MKFRYILSAVALAALVALLPSCRSSKKTVAEAPYEQQAVQEQPVSATPKTTPTSPASDFELMAGAYTPWTDVSVPVKISLTKPNKISLSGTLAMAYGKGISISLRMLFIEAARIYADTDSVIVSSSTLDIYYAESLAKFTAASGLTLSDLQSLLLGQAFAPGKGTLKASDSKLFNIADAGRIADGIHAFTLTPKQLPKSATWHFTAIAPEQASPGVVPQLFSLDIASGSNTVQCSFAESVINQAGVTAAKMQVEATVKKRAVDLVIATTPSKAVWNGGVNLSKPRIPSGARKLTTEQLLKKL